MAVEQMPIAAKMVSWQAYTFMGWLPIEAASGTLRRSVRKGREPPEEADACWVYQQSSGFKAFRLPCSSAAGSKAPWALEVLEVQKYAAMMFSQWGEIEWYRPILFACITLISCADCHSSPEQSLISGDFIEFWLGIAGHGKLGQSLSGRHVLVWRSGTFERMNIWRCFSGKNINWIGWVFAELHVLEQVESRCRCEILTLFRWDHSKKDGCVNQKVAVTTTLMLTCSAVAEGAYGSDLGHTHPRIHSIRIFISLISAAANKEANMCWIWLNTYEHLGIQHQNLASNTQI